MNILTGAVQAVSRTADATTAAAGAVGGAAVNGVVGGIKGMGAGIRNGMSQGSRSPAAAALTLAAVGAAGLVEWPVLLTVGGAALVVHELNQRTGTAENDGTDEATLAPARPSRPRTAKAAGRGSTARRTAASARSK